MDGDGDGLCHGCVLCDDYLLTGKVARGEVYLNHKDGHRVPVSFRTSTLTNESGNVIGGVELSTDISSLKSNELRIKELEAMALLDGLTKLANRNYIEKEILVRFEEKKRLSIPFGILFMDIDRFKRINDTYGHDVGDLVLKLVADTLLKNIPGRLMLLADGAGKNLLELYGILADDS